MYIEELVEVAIGLVLAWLVLSAATSHIQEVIVGWLGLRADGLEDMIESLLKGDRERMGPFSRLWEQIIRRERFSKIATLIPRLTNWIFGGVNTKWIEPLKEIEVVGKKILVWLPMLKSDIRTEMWNRSEIVKKLYNHPIIDGLSLGRNSKPSYISAEDFTTALFDIVTTAGTDESVVQKTLDSLEDNIDVIVADLLVKAGNELANVVKLAEEKKENNTSANQEAFENALQALKKAYPLLKNVDTILNPQTVSDLATTSEELLENESFKKLLGQNMADLLQTELDSLKNLQDSELWIKMNEFRRIYGEKILQTDKAGKLTIDQLQANVASLFVSQPYLSKSLYAIIHQVRANVTEVEDQLGTVRSEVERWFNNSMDRAGGWYKRNRQWGAFAIALFLVFIFNVDSIALGQQLWYEPALRQAIAAQAESYVSQNSAEESPEGESAESGNGQIDIQGFHAELLGLGYPVGWRIDPIGSNTCTLFTENNDLFGIPLGKKCYQPGTQRNGVFVVKLVGWLITALAAMQGAPFWFDLLQKLVGIRGAGKKPDSEEKLGSTSEPAAVIVSVKNQADDKPTG